MAWNRYGARLALALVLAACGGGKGGTKPEDMSAKAHEKAAAQEQAQAEQLETTPRPGRANSTGGNYALAHVHERHAAEHRAAAKELRLEDEAACAGIDDETRASCPLATASVVQVDDLPDGVRVVIQGADPAKLAHEAECHRAYGALEGRKGMPGCPLYNKALAVRTEAVEGGAALILTSTDADTVANLRKIYERSDAADQGR
jgi:hypothetical protein